jgi:hypothetical protein
MTLLIKVHRLLREYAVPEIATSKESKEVAGNIVLRIFQSIARVSIASTAMHLHCQAIN